MGAKSPFFLSHLKRELDKRISKNPKYSLRAFADWLDIDASFLSKVLSRQKVLSIKTADTIITKINPDDAEVRDKFLISVSKEIACYSLYKHDSSITDCDE